MQSPYPEKKSKVSVVIKTAAITTMIAAGIASALPMALSTRLGTKQLSRMLSKRLNGTVQVQSLSLSWLGEQELTGVSFQDSAGRIFFSCQSINSSSSLFKILISKDVSDTVIDNPHLKVKKSEISFLPALKVPMQKASLLYIPSLTPDLSSFLMPLSGRITIKEGAIDFSMPGLDTVGISEVNAYLSLLGKGKGAEVNLEAKTQNAAGTGSLKLDAKLDGSLKPEITLTSKAQNLPIKALDQLASLFNPSLKGQLIDYLGTSLSLDISAKLSNSFADMQIKASSDALGVSLSAKTSDGMFSLQAPASLTLSVSDKLTSRLLPGVEISSGSGAKIEAIISELKMPITGAGYDLDSLSFKAKAALSPMSIKAGDKQAIDLGVVALTAGSASLKQGVDFSLMLPIKNSLQDTSIKASGAITNALNTPQATLKVQAVNVPSALVSSVLNAPLLRDALGDTLSAQVDISAQTDKGSATLSLISEGLRVSQAEFILEKSLFLKAPFKVELMPRAPLLDKLFASDGLIASSKGAITLMVNKMQLSSFSLLESILLNLDAKTEQITLQDKQSKKSYVIDAPEVSIAINTLDDIALKVTSSAINAQLRGSISLKDQLFMSSNPAYLECTISDELAQLLGSNRFDLTLPSPVKAVVNIESLSTSISNPSSKALSMQGTLTVQEASFKHTSIGEEIKAQDTSLSFDYRGKDAQLSGSLKAKLSQANRAQASVDIEGKISNFFQGELFDISSANILSSIQLKKLPADAISLLIPSKVDLAKVIGQEINLEAKIEKIKQQMNLILDAKAPLASANVALIATDGAVRLKDKASIFSITLTPSSQKEIDKLLSQEKSALPLVLQGDAKLRLEVDRLYLPYQNVPCQNGSDQKCLKLGIKEASISATATTSPLPFSDLDNKPSVLVKTAKVQLDKADGKGLIKIGGYLEAVSALSKPSEQVGKVSLQAEMSDLFNEKEELLLGKASYNISLSIDKIPTSMLDLFSRPLSSQVGAFRAIFGQALSATFSLQMKDLAGLIALNVNTQSTRASLSGLITKGILTLSEPIYAQVTMTPELSTFLLAGVNPLSISEIRSSNPITLEVPKEGFSVPIAPFALGSVDIPSARIELGKVQCKNEGNLNIALSLLKSVQLSKDNVLNLWFTPIDMHIKKGVVEVERTDILIADTFDIALWGDIDPIKDRVDMVLGLTADTLSKAFSIKNLPKDYVLQVPMTGTLDNVKLNTTKATAKVAALLAWQQAALAGGAAGGPAGAALGHLLNKVAQLPLNDRDTPPAKRPFPWEGEEKPKQNRPKAKGAHFKKGDKPLKQLWKVIK